jgi:hypothetical protein
VLGRGETWASGGYPRRGWRGTVMGVAVLPLGDTDIVRS